MITTYRFEASCGNGIYHAFDKNETLLLRSYKNFEKIYKRHINFTTIDIDVFDFTSNHICVFLTKRDILIWFDDDEIIELLHKDFKLYEITVNDCLIGNNQGAILKEDIIKKEDVLEKYNLDCKKIISFLKDTIK